MISCQISSEKEKNKSIQGKEKLKVDLARLCTEPPVAPPEAAESTDPLGCPFSRGRAAGKFLDPGTREGSIFRVFDSISIAPLQPIRAFSAVLGSECFTLISCRFSTKTQNG